MVHLYCNRSWQSYWGQCFTGGFPLKLHMKFQFMRLSQEQCECGNIYVVLFNRKAWIYICLCKNFITFSCEGDNTQRCWTWLCTWCKENITGLWNTVLIFLYHKLCAHQVVSKLLQIQHISLIQHLFTYFSTVVIYGLNQINSLDYQTGISLIVSVYHTS